MVAISLGLSSNSLGPVLKLGKLFEQLLEQSPERIVPSNKANNTPAATFYF